AAVSVRVAQGDFAAAQTFCRKLEAAAHDYGSRLWLAMARQAHGELMAAQGNLEEASSAYAEAHAAFTAAGNEYEAARCLMAMAALRARRNTPGDAERAQAERAKAEQMFEQLGAAPSYLRAG
ncbi:MAG: hypothetical protein ACRDH2_13725, partial [Anaerolineales bacterium]